MKHLFIALLICLGALADDEAKTFKTAPHKRHSKGLSKKRLLREVEKPFTAPTPTNVPDKFDLRPEISPIQDQGQCGSCWAFSLTATLMDGLTIAKKGTGSLSQQYLVDCARSAAGCNGGYYDGADYFISPKGAPLLSAYPYTAKDGKCKKKPAMGSIAKWHLLNGTPADIETYMYTAHRPVSTVVAAGAGSWEDYAGGVYNECVIGETDHMINIVGWDNEGAKFDKNGNLPPGKGVWILRNSWSRSWGEDGFMRTKMTDKKGKKCNNVAESAAYLEIK